MNWTVKYAEIKTENAGYAQKSGLIRTWKEIKVVTIKLQ